MGVGAREMGYMFGQYRRLASHVQVTRSVSSVYTVFPRMQQVSAMVCLHVIFSLEPFLKVVVIHLVDNFNVMFMQGSFTGPRIIWSGASLRTEATGYGLV